MMCAEDDAMTRDRRTVARDLLLKAEITPYSVMGLEGEHFLLHQDNVISLVRATLEEAARATCGRCAEGLPITFTHPTFGRMHRTCNSWCKANAIHDLIGALDAKADAGATEER